jgi:hypothetical protein
MAIYGLERDLKEFTASEADFQPKLLYPTPFTCEGWELLLRLPLC